jgi:hypothetical protein
MTLPGIGRLGVLALAWSARAAPDTAMAATDVADQRFPLSLVSGSRLMIDAKINGRPMSALLDSAAEARFLDREFARKLELDHGQTVTGQGSGQSAFSAGLVSGVTIEALGLSLREQTVAVADLADVGRRLLGRRIAVVSTTLPPRSIRSPAPPTSISVCRCCGTFALRPISPIASCGSSLWIN